MSPSAKRLRTTPSSRGRSVQPYQNQQSYGRDDDDDDDGGGGDDADHEDHAGAGTGVGQVWDRCGETTRGGEEVGCVRWEGGVVVGSSLHPMLMLKLMCATCECGDRCGGV